jgi:hypothetical protein
MEFIAHALPHHLPQPNKTKPESNPHLNAWAPTSGIMMSTLSENAYGQMHTTVLKASD